MADLTVLESGLMAGMAAILAAVLGFFTGTHGKVSPEDCDRRHEADGKIASTQVAAIGERITSLEKNTVASIQRLDAKLDQVLLALAK